MKSSSGGQDEILLLFDQISIIFLSKFLSIAISLIIQMSVIMVFIYQKYGFSLFYCDFSDYSDVCYHFLLSSIRFLCLLLRFLLIILVFAIIACFFLSLWSCLLRFLLSFPNVFHFIC